MTYIYLNHYPNGYLYVGSHTWNGEGLDPNYTGSSAIALRYNWIPDSIQILEVVSEDRKFVAEREWIEKYACEFGIAPVAYSVRFHGANVWQSKYSKGILLNGHANNLAQCKTEEWLCDQSRKSKLGNSQESRAKASESLKSWNKDHPEEVSDIRRKIYNSSGGVLSKFGNSPEARAKAVTTRYENMDQWICEGFEELGALPIRILGSKLGLGRGPQQCWSRLNKPDNFIFKSHSFRLVRHKKASCVE